MASNNNVGLFWNNMANYLRQLRESGKWRRSELRDSGRRKCVLSRELSEKVTRSRDQSFQQIF
jgi:hypothetical protein